MSGSLLFSMVEFVKDGRMFRHVVAIGGVEVIRRFIVSAVAIAVLTGVAVVPTLPAEAHTEWRCRTVVVHTDAGYTLKTVCVRVPHQHGGGDTMEG